jgi:ADP-ribosylglycohydrolase
MYTPTRRDFLGAAMTAGAALGLGAAAATPATAPATPALIRSRVLGCLVGSAIGDAFGAVLEFADADRVRRIAGKDWFDRFLPYAEDHTPHPWGVWEAAAPRGAGTDDTRINELFVECVIRNHGFVNAPFLAMEYIERYRDRERYYPRHAALAEEHLSWFLARACERLGMRTLPSGKPIEPEKAPSLMGLISLAPAGLLFCGEPEKAYRAAYELDFVDIGCAVDATAMLAAMVSAALGGGVEPAQILRRALDLDPMAHGASRPMAAALRACLRIADEATDEQDLIRRLAAQVKDLDVFHPADALGVAAAAFYFTGGDPVRTIVVAANDRDVDAQGRLVKLRDVDCTASVAGALVGALRGVEAFPPDWVRDTIDANKRIYGIDLAANARRFCEVVYESRAASGAR